MELMAKIKVAVLRGGPSSEYEVSLKTGEAVLKHLDQNKFEPLDVLINKNGVWHLHGLEAEPQKIFRSVDVIFNAMHGEYGEDGKIQQILETHKVPFTGSGALASATAMHKRLSKRIFELAGINTPRALSITEKDDIPAMAAEAVRKMSLPLVIKPSSKGSSVGVSVARTIFDVILGIESAFKEDSEVLAESYIPGREATCAVLENLRGEKHYAFPVVEIVPPARKSFFDYESKYGGRAQELCPGRFDSADAEKMKRAAVAAHESLGCRHYSRSDFRITPNGKIYILELNTLPGLTSESLFPKAAASVGLEFDQLLSHLVNAALKP